MDDSNKPLLQTDIAVIGGGIQGAGIAQACASRGWKVFLAEQNTWASGTSSKSSKLIHGGLRYLETLQIPLVFHSLRERRILLRNAPHLVKAADFYIPIYEHSQRRPWQIHLGLWLYRCLALFDSVSRFERLPTERWAELEGLEQEGLLAVFRYQDGRTDDAALTRSVVESARSMGATAREHCRLLAAKRRNDGVSNDWLLEFDGVGGRHSVQARFVVNAGGPWVNEVAECFDPSWQRTAIQRVKGSHLILSGSIGDAVYYLESPVDGRAVFAMPHRHGIMLGTTEQDFQGDNNEVDCTDAEQDYLLSVLAHYFPDWQGEVLDRWAGLRVLAAGGERAFSKARDTFFVVQDRGISVYGGKLTAYRHTSERVYRHIESTMGKRPRREDTRKLAIP